MVRSVNSLMCLMLSIAIGGCTGTSDRRQGEAETYYRLERLAQITVSLIDAGIVLGKYQSAEDALSDWKNRGLVEERDYEHLRQDYWGTNFTWEYTTGPAQSTIRIASAGKNGLWEDGAGDDLYVEIQFSDSSRVVYLKPLP